MNSIRRALVPSEIATLVFLVVFVSLSAAKDEPPKKPTDVPATVIAHLPLPQATGNQMLLQKENGKEYLYVQQASKQGFMIVDVSKPEKPNLLKRSAQSDQATSGSLDIVGPDVAIAQAPEKTSGTLTSSNHPTETVRVLDLSDPRYRQSP